MRAVIFDLDGVLVDSETVNVASARESFRRFGIELGPDAGDRIVGRHPVDYVPVLAAGRLDAEAQRELRRVQGRLYRELWDANARLLDGAETVPRRLRGAGLAIALATSAGRAHVEHCLARFSLEGVFDVVTTLEDVAHRKPAPDVYVLTVERLGVPPGSVVVVEDSMHGVEAAKAAGLTCWAVRSPNTTPDAIAAADRVLEGLGDLETIVLGGGLEERS